MDPAREQTTADDGTSFTRRDLDTQQSELEQSAIDTSDLHIRGISNDSYGSAPSDGSHEGSSPVSRTCGQTQQEQTENNLMESNMLPHSQVNVNKNIQMEHCPLQNGTTESDSSCTKDEGETFKNTAILPTDSKETGFQNNASHSDDSVVIFDPETAVCHESLKEKGDYTESDAILSNSTMERISYFPTGSPEQPDNVSALHTTPEILLNIAGDPLNVPQTVKTIDERGSTSHDGPLTESQVRHAIEMAMQNGDHVHMDQSQESEDAEHVQKVVQDFLDGLKDQFINDDKEEPDTTESLAKFVQDNVPAKNIRTIKYALRNLSKAERKAVVDYEIDGKTALFIACETGSEETVEYFVAECDANINGEWKYDCGERDMLVPPLWFATIEEKPEIVKIFSSHGANVNSVCETGSTAVHTACYMNNTELVKILCEHGSDVNIPDTLGGTCLKDSVDNFEICQILIANKADVNFKQEDQYSILHNAIKAHNLDTVKLLVQNGADVTVKDFEGNDCLRYAVLVYAPDIVEFLMDSVNASAPLSADCYDLLGAVAVGKGEYKQGYEFWIRAIYIRTELHGGPTNLKVIPEIYGAVDIPQTIPELIALVKDCDNMDTLGLAIMEHQLGSEHGDTIHRILLQSTSLLHNDELEHAFDMTRYAYSLLLRKHKVLHRLQEFALGQLLDISGKFQINTLRGIAIPRFKEMLEVLREMVDFIEKGYVLKSTDMQYFIQHSNVFDKVIDHVFDMIYLLRVNIKSGEEKSFFKNLIRRIVGIDPRDVHGATLLHKCLTRKPKVVYTFMEPSPREGRHEDLCVMRELIKAGVNVNVQDLKRDTPLHSHLKWIEKFNYFTKKIIDLFLECGLHIDLLDINRTSLLFMLQEHGMNLCPVKYHTLQCLAVKVILDRKIHYRALLPVPLQNFVDMHK